jgi:hypothetical protein
MHVCSSVHIAGPGYTAFSAMALLPTMPLPPALSCTHLPECNARNPVLWPGERLVLSGLPAAQVPSGHPPPSADTGLGFTP